MSFRTDFLRLNLSWFCLKTKSTLNVLNFQFYNCNRCHITFCDETRNKCRPKKHACGLKFNRFFFGVSFFQTAHFLWVSARARKVAHHNDARTHHSFGWKRVRCQNDGTLSRAISRSNSQGNSFKKLESFNSPKIFHSTLQALNFSFEKLRANKSLRKTLPCSCGVTHITFNLKHPNELKLF